MDDLGALDAAAGELERRLTALRPEHYDRPSACTDWSVYDLANHVIGGGHRYLLLLQGAPAEQLAATRTEDHVRPDAVAHHRRWQEPLRAAFAEPGALERVVHHPAGDRTGLDLLRMRSLDLSLHAWDLARSLGLDDSLDEDLAAYLATRCAYLVEELRDKGMYGPDHSSGDGAGPQARLLRLTGRA